MTDLPAKPTSSSRNLVVQHNRLLNSRHVLSLSEQKFYLAMVAQIRQEDKDFESYRIHIKDFVELTGTQHKGMYKQAQEITRNLIKKYLEVVLPDGSLLQTTFLSHAKYREGQGYVEVSFSPELKPYLLQLKKNFTSYDIRNILPLRSKYALRIYELLKQFRNIGERTFALENLLTLLAIPNSYAYAQFKKYILLPAQKEIKEHTDLSFTFKESKVGRRVLYVIFTISSQNIDLSDRPSPTMEILPPEVQAKDSAKRPKDNPNPLYDILELAITSKLGRTAYIAWFEKVEILLREDCICLYFPSRFHADWVKSHHLKDIKEIFPNSRIEIDIIGNEQV